MTPIYFQWDGEAMQPLARFRKLCNKQFVVGEVYCMVAQEERSAASHRQYFASLHEAWLNLPEVTAEQFPSAEHLRKFALIQAGFRDERSIICSSKAEARRLAAFIKPLDEFAIVACDGAMVTLFTAKSQSMRAMGKKTFEASKAAVLEIAWGMCGMKEAEARGHVGTAA